MQFDKWEMPDDEQHLPQWMAQVNNRQRGRLTYQYGKLEAALQHTKDRRAAIDVGAHIGLWSYFMAHEFETLYAFEPHPLHADLWCKNMAGIANAGLYRKALGDRQGVVALETRTKGSSGDTQVRVGVKGETPMITLDSMNLQNIDLIKIDCEGYEEFVLRGAVETLTRCKPCVIVEQKRDMSKRYGLSSQSAVTYLELMGAVLRQEISGDYILSWD